MKLNKAREKLINMYMESLQQDKLPWKRTWNTDKKYSQHNPITNTVFRGVNKLLLDLVAMDQEYNDPRWMTFNQIKQKNWKLVDAKGKGVPIEFWSVYDILHKKTISLKDYYAIINDDPSRKKDFRIMEKTYFVFNAKHIEGMPEISMEEQSKKLMNTTPFIENLIKNMDVRYKEEGNSAFYSPANDCVTIPNSYQFHDEYSYNATRLHELCHASGHESRLNREINNFFGSERYAKEELRAEIAASLIAQEIKLDASQMELDNHKAYIQSWIETLDEDPNELFKAIKDAEKICDYVIDKGEYEKISQLEMQKERLEESSLLTKQEMIERLTNNDIKGIGVEVTNSDGNQGYYFYPNLTSNTDGIELAKKQLFPLRDNGICKDVSFIEISEVDKELRQSSMKSLAIKELDHDERFRYMMLGRMKEDCENYLGFGGRSARTLWANDENTQVKLMKDLYNSFYDFEKPKWITMKKIKEYETEMLNPLQERAIAQNTGKKVENLMNLKERVLDAKTNVKNCEKKDTLKKVKKVTIEV